MRFNDASNKHLSLYHDALYWASADSNSLTIDDFTRSANFALDAVVRRIFLADGRWQYDDANNTDLPIATMNLVANQDNYTIADAHLKIARLRIKNKEGKYVTLEPKDRRDFTDSDLELTGEPQWYDKLGMSVFPLPVPDYAATDGLEITFQRGSNYFTPADTAKEPGFASIFHRYISLYPAREHAIKHEYSEKKLARIDAEIARLDAEMEKFIAMRDRDEKPRMTVKRTTEFY